MTVRWLALAAIVLASCATQTSQSPAHDNAAAVGEPAPISQVRSATQIETAYGVSIVSADEDGRQLKVQVDDESCRRTKMRGVGETAAEVTLHVAVRASGADEACDLVEGGTVFDVQLCSPVWGRRVELSVTRPPADTGECQ